MFGFRSDGKKVKKINPFFKVIPFIMKTRNDSQVYFTQDIPLKTIDKYIDQKAEEGINLSYMNVIYAALVRLLAERPKLNRFVMNGRTYERNCIYISLAIKKQFSDEAEETIIKLPFTGNENIFEIKNKLDAEIEKNKDIAESNSTDKLAILLSHMPNFLFKIIINVLIWFDKHGLLPRSVINASPFHTSAFLTNVGSLGIDAIYHHLYNFGTTGVFLAMGKKKKSFIFEDDNLSQEKSISLAWVADERICDGYYYATSLRLFYKYLNKPEMLEQNLPTNL